MFTHHHSTRNQSTPIYPHSINATGDGTPEPERGIYRAGRMAAELYAIRTANNCGIPQTVFRSTHADVWQHTNLFAAILVGAETFITILPSKYFQ